MVNDTNLSQLFFTLKHSRTPVIFSVPLSPTNNNAQVYGNLPRLLAWTKWMKRREYYHSTATGS